MTTRQFDPYAALGVRPNATQAQIGRAYRARLRQYHPDTREAMQGAQRARADAALQQILTAYTVLRDPVRRADFDRRTRRIDPTPRQPIRADRRGDPGQAPIVAGPVRWQRATGAPP